MEDSSWEQEIAETRNKIDGCLANIDLSEMSSMHISDFSGESKHSLLFQDAAKRQMIQKQREKEVSVTKAFSKAKISSNCPKISKTSASLSTKKVSTQVSQLLADFQELSFDDFSSVFKNLQLIRPGIKEERFLTIAWKFANQEEKTFLPVCVLRDLLVLLGSHFRKEDTIRSLLEINSDKQAAEQFFKEFKHVYEDTLFYLKSQPKKQTQSTENLTFVPKICRKSSDLGKIEENRHEYLYQKQKERKEKVMDKKKKALEEELKDCTFVPTLVTKEKHSRTKTTTVTKRLYENKNASKIIQDTRTTDERELDACTFQPKLCGKPVLNPNNGPRGYKETVERLRKAQKEKEEMYALLEKVPNGENYERNKSLPVKEFSFVNRKKKEKKVILYVDVNVGPGKTGRIAIHEGEHPKELAKNFAKTFDLSREMKKGLENILTEQINALN